MSSTNGFNNPFDSISLIKRLINVKKDTSEFVEHFRIKAEVYLGLLRLFGSKRLNGFF